jgi:DNA-binding transcriptional LysR family regulator
MGATVQLNDRIGRRMKLSDLHVFMTVVQAGSMGKAAQQLKTSQPAISKSIAALEHSLGVRVLDRHPQGIELTEYGRAFLECGAAAFDDLRRGVKNIEYLADPTTGEVRIGANVPVAGGFVSAVVDRFSRHHPGIVFRLTVADPVTLLRELSARNVDLLISPRFDLFADERIDFEFLYDATFAVVVGAQNPWARRRSVELTELINEPWVLPPPESAVGPFVMKIFRASGLDYPRATVIVEEALVRMSLLTSGRFITIIAAFLLRLPAKRPALKVLPVKLPNAPAAHGIVTLKRRTLSPVVQLFINDAREMVKPLVKGIL